MAADDKNAGVYDKELNKNVIAFQTSRGIAPDGLVGPHTMIPLTTVANVAGVPKLEGASGRVELTPSIKNPGEHVVNADSDSKR